jgi:hypothetical protein
MSDSETAVGTDPFDAEAAVLRACPAASALLDKDLRGDDRRRP